MVFEVVDMSPNQKPHVGSLTDRLKEVVYDMTDSQVMSYAEVVGALEITKQHFLNCLEDED
tara:strand:+ start:453 stop:635 length:183 start_codon:yes stop_codon:yes gene_type:complete